MKLKFQNQTIKLLPSGGLFIINKNILIIADLHLGKGVQLQDNAIPLINQIDTPTLAKLKNDIQQYNPLTCIICGDLFHADSPHIKEQIHWFEEEIKSLPCNFILTIGNHDTYLKKYHLKHIKTQAQVTVDHIICSHYKQTLHPSISGHIHPGIKIKKGKIINYYKAFAINNQHIICPSYGFYTGHFTKINPSMTLYYIKNNVIIKHL
tara:strand:+ start:1745 stop:2368 length:624 start_codon:yes stop_codon:yes gene_type:complete